MTASRLHSSSSCMFVGVCVVLAGMVSRAAAQDMPSVPEGKPRIEITVPPPPTRPGILTPMYVSLAGLQAYDGYSTIRGLRTNLTERNPLVGSLAEHPTAFWTIKAVSTITTVYFAECMWRDRHRKEAIVTMVVANVAMGIAAARNASLLRAH